MVYYIYLTTNKVNGKKYIGQHYGEIEDNYLGSGVNLAKAIKKYGKNNFSKEILHLCQSREDADKWEQYYIDLFNAVESENFYNLSYGGFGQDGWRACQDWAKNNPEKAAKIWRKNGERLQKWRIEHPKEYEEKVLKPFLNKSKEWRDKNPERVAEIMKLVNEKKLEWQKNNPQKHQKQVEEWRKKGSITNSQEVICITTGEIFESQSAAARFYNIPQTNISKCIRGERKSAGKHPVTKEKLLWKLTKNS